MQVSHTTLVLRCFLGAGMVGTALLQPSSHFQDSHQFPSPYQPLPSRSAPFPLSTVATVSLKFLLEIRLACSHASSYLLGHHEDFLVVFFQVEINQIWSLPVNMCETILLSVEIIDSFQTNKLSRGKFAVSSTETVI